MSQLFFVVFIIAICVVASAVSVPVNDVQIDSYNFKSLDDQNGYSFNYKLSDGQARDETSNLQTDANGDSKHVVTGSYRYIGPDNVEYAVFYTADEYGFHPFVTHFPISDGLGVQTTPIAPLAISQNAIKSLIG